MAIGITNCMRLWKVRSICTITLSGHINYLWGEHFSVRASWTHWEFTTGREDACQMTSRWLIPWSCVWGINPDFGGSFRRDGWTSVWSPDWILVFSVLVKKNLDKMTLRCTAAPPYATYCIHTNKWKTITKDADQVQLYCALNFNHKHGRETHNAPTYIKPHKRVFFIPCNASGAMPHDALQLRTLHQRLKPYCTREKN